MSFANVGKVWTPSLLEEYLKTIKAPLWANKICLHHTASPNLEQRPKGFTIQHIINIRDFYKNDKGWNRGPHMFVDEDQLFGMTPFNIQGIHAPSFNSNAIGIEVLGDYDRENPLMGRGLECWKNTFDAVRILSKWLNIPMDENHIVFHRECPITKKTSKKSCPGTKVTKEWVISNLNKKEIVKETTTSTGKDLVPVVTYLTDVKKLKYDDAVNKLKRIGNEYFLDGNLLELAYYNTAKGTTYAPKSEIEDALR